MAIGIDHIVIAVRDLAQTSRDFAAAGFTVVPGGEHKTGNSHNALVAFADGTYFELIAFRDPRETGGNPWASVLRESGEGLVDFALRTDDLDREVASLRAGGLEPIGPVAGGRVRPDGQQVAWRTIRFDEAAAPFYCHDETDRSLRVPGGAEAVHANGVTNVLGITLPVSDLAAASSFYGKVTGSDGVEIAGRRRFMVGHQAIDLRVMEGDRPYEVNLHAPAGNGELLPIELTHGARIRVSG
jgi:catechol 2,3-dioxygenase-like lactoylglutathione lyase family enzyme